MAIDERISALGLATTGADAREPVAGAIEDFDARTDLLKRVVPTANGSVMSSLAAIESEGSYDTEFTRAYSIAAGASIAQSIDVAYPESISAVHGIVAVSYGDQQGAAELTVNNGKVHIEFDFGTASEATTAYMAGAFIAVKAGA